MLALVGAVLLFFRAFGVGPGQVDIGWFGLGLLAAHFALGGGFYPTVPRR